MINVQTSLKSTLAAGAKHHGWPAWRAGGLLPLWITLGTSIEQSVQYLTNYSQKKSRISPIQLAPWKVSRNDLSWLARASSCSPSALDPPTGCQRRSDEAMMPGPPSAAGASEGRGWEALRPITRRMREAEWPCRSGRQRNGREAAPQPRDLRHRSLTGAKSECRSAASECSNSMLAGFGEVGRPHHTPARAHRGACRYRSRYRRQRR